MSQLASRLAECVGAQYLVDGKAVEPRYLSDWTQVRHGRPCLLARPKTPAEVAGVLRICGEAGARISVQGGLTGLAEGAAPAEGEVVLSLERLDCIEEIDPIGGTMVVEAGVLLERVQQVAEQNGWFFPLDLGARGSCQIGGNAATNAGGNRVLRYGMARDLILGLEVALADGTCLSMMNRLIKNNAGYDLKHLFIGSEGTLGVVTRLVLKLEPRPLSRCTALCAVASFDALSRLLREARAGLAGQLAAFEAMWDDYYEFALTLPGFSRPFSARHPVYVLIESFGANQERDETVFEDFLERMLESDVVADAIPAQSLREAEAFWKLRDAIGEMLPRIKPYVAFDVGIPLPAMEAFVSSTQEQLAKYGGVNVTFGHIGDGNLHLATGPYPIAAQHDAVERLVYEAVGRAGGSISAEHGIGFLKKPYLSQSRSSREIEIMQLLKRTLDPAGILNPGRIFDSKQTAP